MQQSAIVPILDSPTVAQLLEAINQGFELEWNAYYTTRPLQHSLVTVRINLKILIAHHHHRHLVNQQVCPLFFLDAMIV